MADVGSSAMRGLRRRPRGRGHPIAPARRARWKEAPARTTRRSTARPHRRSAAKRGPGTSISRPSPGICGASCRADAVIASDAGTSAGVRRFSSAGTSRARSSRRPRVRWATACPRLSQRSSRSPSGSSSRPSAIGGCHEWDGARDSVRERTPFVAIVYDNSLYVTIRLVQEREHPGRSRDGAWRCGLRRVRALARRNGCGGARGGDFPAAFEEARRANVPAVLHLRTDPEQLSVNADAG